MPGRTRQFTGGHPAAGPPALVNTGWLWLEGVAHPEQQETDTPFIALRNAVQTLPEPWRLAALRAGDDAAREVDVFPQGNDVDIARRERHRFAAFATMVARFWAHAAHELWPTPPLTGSGDAHLDPAVAALLPRVSAASAAARIAAWLGEEQDRCEVAQVRDPYALSDDEAAAVVFSWRWDHLGNSTRGEDDSWFAPGSGDAGCETADLIDALRWRSAIQAVEADAMPNGIFTGRYGVWLWTANIDGHEVTICMELQGDYGRFYLARSQPATSDFSLW